MNKQIYLSKLINQERIFARIELVKNMLNFAKQNYEKTPNKLI